MKWILLLESLKLVLDKAFFGVVTLGIFMLWVEGYIVNDHCVLYKHLTHFIMSFTAALFCKMGSV